MKKKLRKALFWLHLVVGILAGVLIAVMCFTGLVLVFEKEILSWAERDVVELKVEDGAERLSVDAMMAQVRAEHPERRFSNLVAANDEGQMWTLRAGRREFVYLNPYTAELVEPPAAGLREFFWVNFQLHRWMLMKGESRDTGKAINGAANLGFLGLCITGLYLWWPRNLKWKSFKQAMKLKWPKGGQARDFNWHNVFGFWFLLPLIIATATGAFWSYGWARDLYDGALGPMVTRMPLEQPAQQMERGAQGISLEKQLEIAADWSPEWKTISIPVGKKAIAPWLKNTISVNEGQNFPAASSRLVLDPASGEIVDEQRASELSTKEKWRASIKGVHTGTAGGFIGKLVGALACVAGMLLVYTGFALSWRRLARFRKKKRA